jgi:ABC-type transport system involved in multi-copper enzyme maturation permease subunit
MRAFAAVFGREISERRAIFVVALAAGFIPLLVSFATGWSKPDAPELRILVAFILASTLSLALALLGGAETVAGETRDKRISFYFSRPIPSGAIWAGKLLAAIFDTLAAAVLAFGPAWLAGRGKTRGLLGFDVSAGQTLLGAVVLAFLLVLLSHAVATIARLRSPWAALDVLLASAVVAFAAILLRTLSRVAATRDLDGTDPVGNAAIALAAAAFLALVLASFVQVAEGRTDARRAHGAFSVVLFGILGLAVALLGGYTAWAASSKPADRGQIRSNAGASKILAQ